MNYRWDFTVVWECRGILLGGLWTSLELTAFAVIVGTTLGIPLSLGLISRNPLVRGISTAFVEIMRALPVLVLLIWSYYVIPAFTVLQISAFWTAAIILAVNLAAFVADVLRGGIRAIPREHVEAALALGMPSMTVVRRILIPETFRRSVPSLTALFILTFRTSTLASVIGVLELLHAADTIILDRFKPLEVYSSIAVLYLLVLLPATALAKAVERHRLFSLSPGDSR